MKSYCAELLTLDSNKNLIFSSCEEVDEKEESCIEKFRKTVPTKHKEANIGLLKANWLCCGGSPTKFNYKLEIDEENRISLAFMGIINNYEEMKNELASQYHKTMKSENHSELIMNYVGLFMKSKNELTLQQALNKVLERIKGTWGLIAFDRESPKSLIVSKNQQPFLLGFNNKAVYLTSEIQTLEEQSCQIYNLRNNETIEINLENISSMKENNELLPESLIYKDICFPKSNAPYKTIYEEEIYEQANTLYKTLGHGFRLSHSFEEEGDACSLPELTPHLEKIMNIKNLVLIGRGTAFHAVLYTLKLFRFLETFDSVQVLNLEEFEISDLPLEAPGVILVAETASTNELFQAAIKIKSKATFFLGIINEISLCLSSFFDCIIPLDCGREESLVNTKSFLCEVVMLNLVNIWLSCHFWPNKKNMIRADIKDSIRQMPVFIQQCLTSQSIKLKKMAEILCNETSILIVGKGPSHAIAKEGALKLMQLSKIHTEAIYAGEMKHGPLALINPIQQNSSKIIFLIFEDEYTLDMELTLSEIKLRGAFVIVFTDCIDKLNMEYCDEYFEIPKLSFFSTLLAVIPFQILAYEIGLLKNINPDLLQHYFKF